MESSLPVQWGKSFDPEYRRLADGQCPYCNETLGDMLSDYRGHPNNRLLSFVVGYTTAQYIMRQFAIGAAIFECPKCLELCWFHVEEPWARLVEEFAPKSPRFEKIRKSLSGNDLFEALSNMNVMDEKLLSAVIEAENKKPPEG